MSGILEQLSESIDGQIQALPGKSASAVKDKIAQVSKEIQEKNPEQKSEGGQPPSAQPVSQPPVEGKKTLEQRAQEEVERFLQAGKQPEKPEEKKPEEKNTEPVKTKKDEDTEKFLFFKGEKQNEKVTDIPDGLSYLAKNLNIEFKKPEDFQGFVTNYNNMLQEKEKMNTELNRVKYFEDVINAMPDDLYGALNEWLNDKDYRAYLNEQLSQKIDFSKPYHKHSTKDLIQFYYPNKFSEDDLEDKDNKAVQVLMETVEARYEQDQSKYRNKEKSYRDNEKNALNEFTEMLGKSQQVAESYFNSLPLNFRDEHKSSLKKLMDKGQQGLLLEFFKPDGTWKENAMEQLAYLRYGKEQLDLARKLIEREVQSKVNEEMVQRGADRPTPVGGSGKPDIDYSKVTEYVKKVVPQKKK